MEATVNVTADQKTFLTTDQQEAISAAKRAGGLFVSSELLKSKAWLEQLVRGDANIQENMNEFIAQTYYEHYPQAKRYPDLASILRDIREIREDLYKELEQEVVDGAVKGLLEIPSDIHFYIPGCEPE